MPAHVKVCCEEPSVSRVLAVEREPLRALGELPLVSSWAVVHIASVRSQRENACQSQQQQIDVHSEILFPFESLPCLRRLNVCASVLVFLNSILPLSRPRGFLQSAVPLGMFIGSTFLAITFMGGVYAVLPAYEADLFGEFFQDSRELSPKRRCLLEDCVCARRTKAVSCRFGAIAA